MKKLYILLGLTLISSAFTFGQDVEIKDFNNGNPSGANLNGTTITQVASEDELVIISLGVTNISGSDKVYSITRDKITDIPAWSGGATPEQICWGPYPDTNFEGICLQPNSDPWSTTNDFTMSDDGLAWLKFDIHTYSAGSIHYRFYIMDQTTKVDSVDIVVTTTLGTKAPKNEEISLSVYPNPVSNTLSIATQGMGDDFNVKITDVLGKVVYNDASNSATKKVDVSEFKNGVYMVAITEKGVGTQTRRIVVKH